MEAKVTPLFAARWAPWHVLLFELQSMLRWLCLIALPSLSPLPQGWWSQEKEDEARSSYRLPAIIHTEIPKRLITLSPFTWHAVFIHFCRTAILKALSDAEALKKPSVSSESASALLLLLLLLLLPCPSLLCVTVGLGATPVC